MRSLFKRITPVILALALVLSFGMLSACKDEEPTDPPTATVFTVIVKYEDGTAVDGANGWDGYETCDIRVQFCQVDASYVVGTCYPTVKLGADGTVTFDPADLAGTDYQGKYKVAVNNIPVGYTVEPEYKYVDATPQTINFILKAVA